MLKGKVMDTPNPRSPPGRPATEVWPTPVAMCPLKHGKRYFRGEPICHYSIVILDVSSDDNLILPLLETGYQSG